MNTENIGQLISRLNAVFGLIHCSRQAVATDASSNHIVLQKLEAQGLVFAGFLSDIETNRIHASDPHVLSNMQLIENFCHLIETELAKDQS